MNVLVDREAVSYAGSVAVHRITVQERQDTSPKPLCASLTRGRIFLARVKPPLGPELVRVLPVDFLVLVDGLYRYRNNITLVDTDGIGRSTCERVIETWTGGKEGRRNRDEIILGN